MHEQVNHLSVSACICFCATAHDRNVCTVVCVLAVRVLPAWLHVLCKMCVWDCGWRLSVQGQDLICESHVSHQSDSIKSSPINTLRASNCCNSMTHTHRETDTLEGDWERVRRGDSVLEKWLAKWWIRLQAYVYFAAKLFFISFIFLHLRHITKRKKWLFI